MLDGVPPGKGVHVVARHPAFVSGRSDDFDVAGGASTTGKDVVLRAGGTIEAEVRNARGDAVAGAKVELSYAEALVPKWDLFEGFSGDATRRTDARGRVREDRVPLGMVVITVTHRDFAPVFERKSMTLDSADPVLVAIVLPDPVVVSATPEGATAGLGGRTTTGPDGRFRLDRVPPATVTLFARAAGHRPDSVPAAAPTDGVEILLVPLDLDLEGGREKILRQMGEAAQRLQQTHNDAEREALTADIQALQRELAELPAEER